ncbi:YciI family protein [Bacillus sp. JJ1521]|uniref:YciI family protein n=1 Tax=Bacillus sp. JJ1521 TaxID=3122957 RepID=UPI0030006212
MKYFAAISTMLDMNKNNQLRDAHLDYLNRLAKENKVFAKGKFSDGTGGLIIYKANSLEESNKMAKDDPFIIGGARSYEIHEWEMKQ